MTIDGLHIFSKDLLLVSIFQEENDVISVGFDSKGEEFDVKFNPSFSEIFKSKSESPAHDEDLDGLVGAQEVPVGFHELAYVVVRKLDGAITMRVFSFVGHKNGDEVYQLDDGLLILINLRSFDFDQLVADILVDI